MLRRGLLYVLHLRAAQRKPAVPKLPGTPARRQPHLRLALPSPTALPLPGRRSN